MPRGDEPRGRSAGRPRCCSPRSRSTAGVDAAWACAWITNDQAVRQASHQVARTANQLADEEQSAHGAKDEGYRRAELAREAHARLAQTGEPVLLGTLSLICSAPTVEELNGRVRASAGVFPTRCTGRSAISSSCSPSTCRPADADARLRAAVHVRAGRGDGPARHPRGRLRHRSRAVHGVHGRRPPARAFDLREASRTDRPPTIALLGTLGGGKTQALQLLLYHALVQGARIVDIDPKGDHRFHLLPEVRDRRR